MIQTPIDTIRVLIADDHQLVRDLVSLHLTAQGGTTVRTAETLGDALNAVEEEGAFDPETGLSPKEIVVLRGIRAGLMNKEIASQMKMSEVTIKMYVRSICTKLNARNRTHAAMLAGSLALN
jgi:DNA-binding NarL/FixJ family response regulator